jgi:hypothetical protein
MGRLNKRRPDAKGRADAIKNEPRRISVESAVLLSFIRNIRYRPSYIITQDTDE